MLSRGTCRKSHSQRHRSPQSGSQGTGRSLADSTIAACLHPVAFSRQPRKGKQITVLLRNACYRLDIHLNSSTRMPSRSVWDSNTAALPRKKLRRRIPLVRLTAKQCMQAKSTFLTSLPPCCILLVSHLLHSTNYLTNTGRDLSSSHETCICSLLT